MRRIQFFREKKYLFKIFQIHHLHVYFDIIPSPDIRGAFKNIASSFLSHTKCTNRGKEPPCVDKRNIDHIYINCWFTVYSRAEIEQKTDKQYPPPPHTHTHTHTHTPIPVNVRVCDGVVVLITCIYFTDQ